MGVNFLEQGEGILKLLSGWVPRVAYLSGRRLKLHPDDLYASGVQPRAIDTRWLSSTPPADSPLFLQREGKRHSTVWLCGDSGTWTNGLLAA
jgi:hypothetical protein